MKVGVSLLRGKLQNIDSRHSVKQPMMDLHWGLGPKYPVMNITFELDIRFLKMGGVFSWIGTDEIWRESGPTLGPFEFLIL
jgi:hypothetical protein